MFRIYLDPHFHLSLNEIKTSIVWHDTVNPGYFAALCRCQRTSQSTLRLICLMATKLIFLFNKRFLLAISSVPLNSNNQYLSLWGLRTSTLKGCCAPLPPRASPLPFFLPDMMTVVERTDVTEQICLSDFFMHPQNLKLRCLKEEYIQSGAKQAIFLEWSLYFTPPCIYNLSTARERENEKKRRDACGNYTKG